MSHTQALNSSSAAAVQGAMASILSIKSSSAMLGSSLRQQGGLAARSRTSAMPLTVTAAWGKLPNVGGGRKWEHKEVNKNGKPVKIGMHVKKGDTVQVSVEWQCKGARLGGHRAKLVFQVMDACVLRLMKGTANVEHTYSSSAGMGLHIM